VYVRLHPYRQHDVARRLNMKLAAIYFGSYKVVGSIEEVAY
jgi:Zn-dependent protease